MPAEMEETHKNNHSEVSRFSGPDLKAGYHVNSDYPICRKIS